MLLYWPEAIALHVEIVRLIVICSLDQALLRPDLCSKGLLKHVDHLADGC